MKGVGVLISLIQNKTSQSNLSRIAEQNSASSENWGFKLLSNVGFYYPPAIKTTQWYLRPLSIENSLNNNPFGIAAVVQFPSWP